jgi:hypothetical protein
MQFPCVFVHRVRQTLYSLAGCLETDARAVGASRHSGQLKALTPGQYPALWQRGPACHAIDRPRAAPSARDSPLRYPAIFLSRPWPSPQISQLLLGCFRHSADGNTGDTHVRQDTR